MNINRKVIALLLAVFGLVTAIFFAVEWLFVYPNYARLEERNAEEQKMLFVDSLTASGEELKNTAITWADWLEDFQPDQSNDAEYEELARTVQNTAGLDAVLLLDGRGLSRWRHAMEMISKNPEVFSLMDKTHQEGHLQEWLNYKPDAAYLGFIAKEDGVLILAGATSQPAGDSWTSGAILLLGKFLSHQSLKESSDFTSIHFENYPTATGVAFLGIDQHNALLAGGLIALNNAHAETLNLFTLLSGINSENEVLVSAVVPHQVMPVGSQALWINILAFIIITIFLIPVIYIFFRNALVTPLTDLIENVRSVSADSDMTRRIDVDRDDEIGQLANEFNKMLTQIDKDMQLLEADRIELLLVQSALDDANDGVLILDNKNTPKYMNSRFCNMIQVTTDNFTLDEFKECFPDPQAFDQLVERGMHVETQEIEFVLRNKRNKEFWASVRSSVILSDDFEVEGVLFLITDSSQQKALEEKLTELATQDGLTKVANRRAFDETLENELQRISRSDSALSLILLDVDHFKPYNDNYGHQAGDDALIRVGATLKDSVQRSSDFVARYGGEEFAVIMPFTDAAGAKAKANSMLEDIRAIGIKHEYSSCANIITVSLGMVTLTAAQNCSASEMVEHADQALYQAKESGRNQVYHTDLTTSTPNAG